MILDINKDLYFKNIDKIKRLFLNEITINNIKYVIKSIICYPGGLNYNSFIINSLIDVFNLKKILIYFMTD